jgi:hypothetical protein
MSFRTGTNGEPCGSNPGAIFLKAFIFRRSFSSSLDCKYALVRTACAANVDLRDDSKVRICDSIVNG